MTKFNEFYNLLLEYDLIFDELIAFEEKKAELLPSSQAEQLDALMKDEQVYLLRLRGLDVKREKLQADMGMKDLTFGEIIERTTGTERDLLENCFRSLSKKTAHYKSMADVSKRFIEIHLHSLDMIITSLGGESAVQAAYDKNGARTSKAVSKFQPKRV